MKIIELDLTQAKELVGLIGMARTMTKMSPIDRELIIDYLNKAINLLNDCKLKEDVNGSNFKSDCLGAGKRL